MNLITRLRSTPLASLARARCRIVNLGADANQFQVPVTTIDGYGRSLNIKPSLIKIDVEGFEFSVLNGERNTLKEFRPLVLVELHPMNWPALGIDPRWAAAQLAELNYTVTAVANQTDIFSEHGHVMFEPDKLAPFRDAHSGPACQLKAFIGCYEWSLRFL